MSGEEVVVVGKSNQDFSGHGGHAFKSCLYKYAQLYHPAGNMADDFLLCITAIHFFFIRIYVIIISRLKFAKS